MSLMANDVTSTSVRLVWSLGFSGNAIIIGIRITYTTISNYNFPQNETVIFSGATVTGGVISNLQPFTGYRFEVVVITDVGGMSIPVTVFVQTLSLGK